MQPTPRSVAPLTARSSAAISGQGTGYTVSDSVWTRERTPEGKLYYFNHADGSSQWHLPTELYESSRKTGAAGGGGGGVGTLIFPASAKAAIGVDCLTEIIVAPDPGAGARLRGNVSDIRSAAEACDPREVHELLGMLPENFASVLGSEDFEALCFESFAELAGDAEGADVDLEGAAVLLCSMAGVLGSDVPLRLGNTRGRKLAGRFGQALVGDGQDASSVRLNLPEFIGFARFAITVQYLDRASGLEK